MKILYPAAVVLGALAVLAPVIAAGNKIPAPEQVSEPPAVTESVQQTPAPAEYAPSLDGERTVMLLLSGDVREMPLDRYLEGVLAAEMPASFEQSALEAQCIAARTYAVSRASSGVHDGGVCADPGCCEAYVGDAELHAKWGEDYDANIARIRAAVAATDSLILTYGGEPIFAAFHSSSSGCTEDCASVWGSELPYLVSVDTPESPENVPQLVQERSVPAAEFRNTVLAALPGAVFVAGPDGWLTEAEYTPSGRLASVRVGTVRVTGTELRSLFALRSTKVTWSVSDEGVTFFTEGYGHGVGMSQYGANILAREGADAAEILAHYYPGTVLEKSVENVGVPM